MTLAPHLWASRCNFEVLWLLTMWNVNLFSHKPSIRWLFIMWRGLTHSPQCVIFVWSRQTRYLHQTIQMTLSKVMLNFVFCMRFLATMQCDSQSVVTLNTLSGSYHFRYWLLDGTSNGLCCLSLPQLDTNISDLLGEEVTKFDMVLPACLTIYPHNTWYISVSTFHTIIHVKTIFLVYPVFWSILA